MVKNREHSILDLPAINEKQASRLMSVLLSDFAEDEIATDIAVHGVPRIENYLIDELIGSGGGGDVYRGVRVGSDRRVAIKILHKRLDMKSAAKRAWRELELLEQLHVAGFPHVYDYGIQDGRMFIVSDHVDGLTINKYCRKHHLGRKACVGLLIKVALKLKGLHELGVIHRDVKPDNIIIDGTGNPVIIDLGIATLIADDVTETLTAEGSPMGSPAFMSPEQARGERDAISTLSDVYGLAATACRILTKQTPHDVKTVPLHEAIRRVAQDPPRSPRVLDPSMPIALVRVLERALSIEPSQRHASMSEFADDLQRWLDGKPISWQKPNWLERQRLSLKRNPKSWLLKAAVWMLAILLIGSSGAAAGFRNTANLQQELFTLKEKQLHDEAVAQQVLADKLARERELFAIEMQDEKDHWESEARKREAWSIEVRAMLERQLEVLTTGWKQIQFALDNEDRFDFVIKAMKVVTYLESQDFSDLERVQFFSQAMREFYEQSKNSIEE